MRLDIIVEGTLLKCTREGTIGPPTIRSPESHALNSICFSTQNGMTAVEYTKDESIIALITVRFGFQCGCQALTNHCLDMFATPL